MLIGALSHATGVPAKTLRYWEGEGLLHEPARTAGGYRDYAPAAIGRVRFIRQAQDAGLTLRQIREILAISDDGQAPCRHAAALVAERLAEVERRLADLQRTRRQLRDLQQRLTAVDPAACPPETICVAIAPG